MTEKVISLSPGRGTLTNNEYLNLNLNLIQFLFICLSLEWSEADGVEFF